ncbi:MAG: serine hydrolase [Thermodesulfobacteriota bacterium]
MPVFSKVDTLMHRAVEEGAFPGAVLLISAEDKVLSHRAYGHASIVPSRQLMTTDTLFDLASLTKPLATTMAIMTLVADGELKIDQEIGDILGLGRGNPKAGITLRQLLSHSSGMPAYQPYFEQLRTYPPGERKKILRGWLLDEPLAAIPGEAALYSDLGFMLLEWIIEKASGQGLDEFVPARIYRPLGLVFTGFRSLNSRSLPDPGVIAATEECPWRKKVLRGEVHDDNAYAVGGVCGHAGLFGTSEELYGLLKMILNAYRGETETGIFSRELMTAFLTRQELPRGTTWALGFDTPSEEGSSAGRYFSRKSVGHLGFTGVSFWMDLEREIIILLLTNRIHPSRTNEKIKAFRPLIHDAIMEPLI